MILNTNSYKTFLSEELARRKQANPRYSQRAFAKQMGLSAGELSEILTGKRALSLKSALRISKSLGLNSTETKHLIQLLQMEKAGSLADEELVQKALQAEGRQLGLDLFHIVSDWYCYALLNLTETSGFSWNIQWIAKRLGISSMEARLAIQRLERVGLVEMKNGKRVVSSDYVITSSGIPSEAIRNYHRQILKKAAAALELQNINDRDITGIGFAVDAKDLGAIKKEISDFQDQIVAKYSKGKKTEVYHLEVALFRLSEGEVNDSQK